MAKSFLLHLDDVGASAGSVIAWKALRAAGVVRSASVMVPCAYYRFAIEDYLEDNAQDLGIHVTLTSEWSRYRWRPLTGPVAGLVDGEGYFHRRPEAVAANADPDAVEDEMAAQIERALSDGIRPTHIDAHMGTAFLPQFIERLWKLADRYRLPLPVCRDMVRLFDIVRMHGLDLGYFREVLAEAERRRDPVFETFFIGFTPEGQTAETFYASMANDASEGQHWLAMHANSPDDLATYAPHMARAREAEYRCFSDKRSADLFGDAALINWHDLKLPEARPEAGPPHRPEAARPH